MAASKVIVLTGASRGIGLAIAHSLLKNSHKVVLVSRTAAPLEEVKKQYPGQVEYVAADLSDYSVAKKVIDLTLSTFSRIDGMILNHGILDAVARTSNVSIADYEKVFSTNFFSLIPFIQAGLPSLRETKGRIIMTSSGAATGYYATWGAYGSSKAALNHLTGTLNAEEPDVTVVAVRPGVVDTGMQRDIREVHHESMSAEDMKKFKGLHADGKLLRPEQPGNVMARLALDAPRELGGKFVSWDDASLAKFQDS